MSRFGRGWVVKKFAFIAAAIGVAGVASASTIDLTFKGSGAGTSVKIIAPTGNYSGFAGELKFDFSYALSGTDTTNLRTFCTELAQQTTQQGQTHTYNIKDVSQLPDPPAGPTGMGTAKADNIRELYTVAAGNQFGNNINAAAFQLAIWNLVYDTDFTLDSGVVRTQTDSYTDKSSILSQANAWLNAVNTNSYSHASLVGLGSDTKQDQIFLVPLPAPVALGLAGLVGVGVVRRFRPR